MVFNELPAICLVGNLPDVVITTAGNVRVNLYVNEQNTLSEFHIPNPDGRVILRYKEVLGNLLKTNLPRFVDSIFEQTENYATIKIDAYNLDNEVISTEFIIVKGGVDTDVLDSKKFLDANFLTWQEQEKKVNYYDPNWLTYYATEATDIKVLAYFSDGSSTKQLAHLEAGKCYTMNVSTGAISAYFNNRDITAWEVWADRGGNTLTYIQRFLYTDTYDEYNDVFVFENTLGGLDSIRFTGVRTNQSDFQIASAQFGTNLLEYNMVPKSGMKKNSGFFDSKRQQTWALEFFKSIQKYWVDEGVLKRIVTSNPQLDSIDFELSAYVFQFGLSEKSKYFNLPRMAQIPEILPLKVGTNNLQKFTPNINEFPIAPNGDMLIPVQSPYDGKWYNLNVLSLFPEFKSQGASILIGSPFKLRYGDESVVVSNGNTIVTDFRLKGKNDYVVNSTQVNNTAFRDNEINFDSNIGRFTLLNFELQAGEMITVHLDGIPVTKPGNLIDSLFDWKDTVDMVLAPILMKALVFIFKKPANEIPSGWQECLDLRGRIPVGWDPSVAEFATILNSGGAREKTLSIDELPEHDLGYTRAGKSQRPNGRNTGSAEMGWGDVQGRTEKIGKGQTFSIMNPYRVVTYIEFVGVNTQ